MKPTTQQLLDILRDARDEGLWREQSAVLAELELDMEAPIARTMRACGASRLTTGTLTTPLETGEWMTSVEESRARRATHAAQIAIHGLFARCVQ